MKYRVNFFVNEEPVELYVEANKTLLRVLREELALTGHQGRLRRRRVRGVYRHRGRKARQRLPGAGSRSWMGCTSPP